MITATGERIRTALALITAQAILPITIADAKDHCRITDEYEQTLIDGWIRAATRKVEQDIGRTLLSQTWDLYLDGFPYGGCPIEIPNPPLQSVTSVKSTDTNGTETTLSASNYIVDTASEPGRIGLTDTGAWPSALRQFQSGRVRFVAGYTSAVAMPDDLRHAVRLLVGQFSEHREPIGPSDAAVLPLGYTALIAPYVIHTVA